MSLEPTQAPAPEKPFAALQTIYFSNPEKKQFFRQNSPTGGTYMECWIKGKDFAHILSTVEFGTPEKLASWMQTKQMEGSTEGDYYSNFFWLCRQLDMKRSSKNDKRKYDTLGI
jgi:hypothetical protein